MPVTIRSEHERVTETAKKHRGHDLERCRKAASGAGPTNGGLVGCIGENDCSELRTSAHVRPTCFSEFGTDIRQGAKIMQEFQLCLLPGVNEGDPSLGKVILMV